MAVKDKDEYSTAKLWALSEKQQIPHPIRAMRGWGRDDSGRDGQLPAPQYAPDCSASIASCWIVFSIE